MIDDTQEGRYLASGRVPGKGAGHIEVFERVASEIDRGSSANVLAAGREGR